MNIRLILLGAIALSAQSCQVESSEHVRTQKVAPDSEKERSGVSPEDEDGPDCASIGLTEDDCHPVREQSKTNSSDATKTKSSKTKTSQKTTNKTQKPAPKPKGSATSQEDLKDTADAATTKPLDSVVPPPPPPAPKPPVASTKPPRQQNPAPPVTPPAEPENPNFKTFRIKAQTGDGPYNKKEDMIVMKVGQELEVCNDDTENHRIHTNGSPFPHGNMIAPGTCTTYELRRAHDPGNGQRSQGIYDHISGNNASFWLKVEAP